jgi:hypothetical protein
MEKGVVGVLAAGVEAGVLVGGAEEGVTVAAGVAVAAGTEQFCDVTAQRLTRLLPLWLADEVARVVWA